MRQLVLDTETTGLNAQAGDRIIEIGCVELVGRKPTGNDRHYYINPDRDSHEDALRVHGITTAFLADKPRFSEIADELLEYLEGAEVLIHNAAFDLDFLDKELERSGRPPLRRALGEVTDTLALAKTMFPGARNSLDALCSKFSVDNTNRALHGALLDARLLADVYIRMTRGQDGLFADGESSEVSQAGATLLDLRQFDLPVIMATPEELAAHEKVMAEIRPRHATAKAA